MWMKMHSISVREEQGAKIIREVCHNKVSAEVVLDPTYLMTKDQWESEIPVKKMEDKKYVFCYFLGNDNNAKRCAKRYAEKHNLYLVSILSCESFDELDLIFADKVVGAASPEDFINWIRGAECVFTDSFHGLAFSIINHKQFFVFYRKRNDAKLSRNSRIDNILTTFGCEDRLIIDPNVDWDRVSGSIIDYKIVDELKEVKRQESLEFIRKALQIDEN